MTSTTELPFPAVTADPAQPFVDPSQRVAANAGQIAETDVAKVMTGDERDKLATSICEDSNPAYASAVTSISGDGRVRRAAATTIGGRTKIGNAEAWEGDKPATALVVTAPDATGRLRRVFEPEPIPMIPPDVSPEVYAARGSAASVTERLARAIDVDGLPLVECYGAHKLIQTRTARGQIGLPRYDTQGHTIGKRQLIINLVGNSYLDNPYFIAQHLRWILTKALGDAGLGYIPVTRSSINPEEAELVHTGDWTVANSINGDAVTSATLREIRSSTAGAKLTFTQKGGASDTVALFAFANDAVVAVSKNGGAATNVTLSQLRTNLGVSLAAGDVLTITVVAGTVTAYGLDCRRDQPGVRINKLAVEGSTWADQLAVPAATVVASYAELKPDLTIMLESVNGAYQYDAPAEIGYLDQMIGRVRAGTPFTDILTVSPAETMTNYPYSLRDRQVAYRHHALGKPYLAHLDLQYAFGPILADYVARGFFQPGDKDHPHTPGRELMARVLADHILGGMQ